MYTGPHVVERAAGREASGRLLIAGRRMPRLLVALFSVVAMGNAIAGPITAHAAPAAATSATLDSWPAYLHDLQRTAASTDTTLSTANVAGLKKSWSYTTGGIIAAGAAVVNGTAYIGSWDGYEYALNASTGALRWKAFLGQTTPSASCQSPTAGVTSSAAVVNGVVYVGGGDAYWYALNASTGAVLWKVYTGDNSATGGHYNWSSPLIYSGYAYIGIASYGDCPLVQGQLLQVSLTSHQVVQSFSFVPNGQVGGGVWSSPSVDPATNTVYVTTGTLSDSTQTMSEAVVALDATTLALKGSWQIPRSAAVTDSDWGNTPILFDDPHGRHLVAATNKNGVLYAFDRGNLGAGPVWQLQIAAGGTCPQCGDGSASSLAFGNGLLYVAGGNTTINGQGYPGAVRAIDPTTGAVVWQHGDPNPIIPALACDNGFVIAAEGPALEVLDAATGLRLYSYLTGATIYGPPSIANGTIYAGSNDNAVYAFTLPSTPPPPPPADPACPSNWTCQDVGGPKPPGSESVSGASWTIVAGGSGVGGSSDSFRLITQKATGNTQVAGQVVALKATSTGAQVGLMLRQSADAASPYYALLATPGGGLTVRYRLAWGGATTTAKTVANLSLPVFLEIQRIGDTLQAAISTDGVTYTLVPGTTQTVAMPATVLIGVAASSGANGTAGSATIRAVALGAPSTAPNPAPTASPCPTGWTCADIGNPALVGDQSLASGNWAVSGAGTGIAAYADQLHYVWQKASGDTTLTAQIMSQGNTSASAKAGLMFRQATDTGAVYYAVFVTPGKGLVVQYRSTQGLRTTTPVTAPGAAPQWLRIARSGSVFSAYTSPDGSTWTYLSSSAVMLSMSSQVLAGLAVSSSNGGAVSTASFSSVSMAPGAPPAPIGCPAGWSCGDIGNPAMAGNEGLATGQWTIQGGGTDIWGAWDQFHFDWQTLSADGDVSAQITSQTESDPWAKAGLMMRGSTDGAAPYYGVFVTPSNGIVVQYRGTSGAATVQPANITGAAPAYVEVARFGTTFTAYYSTDGGQTWSPIPGSTVTLANLGGMILAGLVVTAHNGSTLSTVTMQSVAIRTTAPTPPGACLAGWSCTDVGNPASGTQEISGGTWTVNTFGYDVWGTNDQFRFIFQSLVADGTISAQVTSQTNTDPWAKAGVMLRGSTDAGAPFYAVYVTPGNGITVQLRSAAGSPASQLVHIAGVIPAYLMVARSGTIFTAYTSSDGASWTPIAGSTVSLANLGETLLAGLAVTTHSAQVNTAVFASVTLTSSAPTPPGACPANWTCSDVGSPALSGTQDVSNATWTVQGAGYDIWGTSDQFHYDFQSLAADGGITARVVTQTNTDPWAKAGVMLRASTDSGAAFYAAYITPGNGIVVQYRGANGGSAVQLVQMSGATPIYLKVARSGTTFTAYTSQDGSTWTPIAGSTISSPNLSGAILAGLAVTSHSSGALSSVAFDTVSLTRLVY